MRTGASTLRSSETQTPGPQEQFQHTGDGKHLDMKSLLPRQGVLRSQGWQAANRAADWVSTGMSHEQRPFQYSNRKHHVLLHRTSARSCENASQSQEDHTTGVSVFSVSSGAPTVSLQLDLSLINSGSACGPRSFPPLPVKRMSLAPVPMWHATIGAAGDSTSRRGGETPEDWTRLQGSDRRSMPDKTPPRVFVWPRVLLSSFA